MMKRLSLLIAATMLVAGCATNRPAGDTAQDDGFRDPAAQGEVVLLKWSGQRSHNLPTNCGGSVAMVKDHGKFFLDIKGTQCSNVKTPFTDKDGDKLLGKNHDRHGRVALNGAGWHQVQVGGNDYISGKKPESGTMFYVETPPQDVVLDLRGDGVEGNKALASCGYSASVRGKIARDGTVNLVFSNIDTEKCNTFDLLSNDGDPLDYKAKGLESSCSRSIPGKFIQWGGNGVVVNVYRPYRGNERILVKFDGKPDWWPFN